MISVGQFVHFSTIKIFKNRLTFDEVRGKQVTGSHSVLLKTIPTQMDAYRNHFRIAPVRMCTGIRMKRVETKTSGSIVYSVVVAGAQNTACPLVRPSVAEWRHLANAAKWN